MTNFNVNNPGILHRHVLNVNDNYGIAGKAYARSVGTLLVLAEKAIIVAINILTNSAYTAGALALNLVLLPPNAVQILRGGSRIKSPWSLTLGVKQLAKSVVDTVRLPIIAVKNIINPNWLKPENYPPHNNITTQQLQNETGSLLAKMSTVRANQLSREKQLIKKNNIEINKLKRKLTDNKDKDTTVQDKINNLSNKNKDIVNRAKQKVENLKNSKQKPKNPTKFAEFQSKHLTEEDIKEIENF